MIKLTELSLVQFTQEQKGKLRKLRKLIKRNEQLEVGTEDVLLSKFLYHTNWNVQDAYKGIINYYDFKLRHPKWVANNPVQYFKNLLLKTPSRFIMPKPDKDGRLIVVIKSAVEAFDKYPNYMFDVIQMDDMIYESLLLLPEVQRNGLTVINDLSGTTKNFLRIITPANARLISEKTNISPCDRIIHLIQKGFLMNATSALVMPFLDKEVKKKIFTHDGKNFDKLREMVGYKNLPAGLGGPKENVLDPQLLYSHLLEHEEYLIKLQSYRKKSLRE